MSDISILVATRRDSPLIMGFLYNIMETAVNPNNVEVVVSLSSTDTATESEIHRINSYNRIKVVPIRDDKSGGRYALYKYMNHCAEVATGKVLWHMCDDHRMISVGYDQIVQESCVPLSDKIRRFVPRGEKIDGFCCPIVTRRWYETLGHWANGHAVDAWVGQIGNKLPADKGAIILNDIEIRDLTISNSSYSYDIVRPDPDYNSTMDHLQAGTQWLSEATQSEIQCDYEVLLKKLEEES